MWFALCEEYLYWDDKKRLTVPCHLICNFITAYMKYYYYAKKYLAKVSTEVNMICHKENHLTGNTIWFRIMRLIYFKTKSRLSSRNFQEAFEQWYISNSSKKVFLLNITLSSPLWKASLCCFWRKNNSCHIKIIFFSLFFYFCLSLSLSVCLFVYACLTL